MYEAWKAQLLPALEQLGFDDRLINGTPTDADVMAFLDSPKGRVWDAALYNEIVRACAAGSARSLCEVHKKAKSGCALLHAIRDQEEFGANRTHRANAACAQLAKLHLTPSKDINEFINDFR